MGTSRAHGADPATVDLLGRHPLGRGIVVGIGHRLAPAPGEGVVGHDVAVHQYLQGLLALTNQDLLAHMGVGHRVVVAADVDVAVLAHAVVAERADLVRIGGHRTQVGSLFGEQVDRATTR